MREFPINDPSIDVTLETSTSTTVTTGENFPSFEEISEMNAKDTREAMSKMTHKEQEAYQAFISERNKSIKKEVQAIHAKYPNTESKRAKILRDLKEDKDAPITIKHRETPSTESQTAKEEPYTWNMWRDETRQWLVQAKEFTRSELAKNVKRTTVGAKREMIANNDTLNHIQETIPKLEHNFATQAKLEQNIAQAQSKHAEMLEQFNYSLASSIKECASSRDITNLESAIADTISRHKAQIQELEDNITSMVQELKALQSTSVAMVQNIEDLALPKSEKGPQTESSFITKRLPSLAKGLSNAHTPANPEPKSRLLQMYDTNIRRGGDGRRESDNKVRKEQKSGFLAFLRKIFIEE